MININQFLEQMPKEMHQARNFLYNYNRRKPMLSCIQCIIAYDKHNAQLFHIEINRRWIFIGYLNTNLTASHYLEIKSLHRLFYLFYDERLFLFSLYPILLFILFYFIFCLFISVSSFSYAQKPIFMKKPVVSTKVNIIILHFL